MNVHTNALAESVLEWVLANGLSPARTLSRDVAQPY